MKSFAFSIAAAALLSAAPFASASAHDAHPMMMAADTTASPAKGTALKTAMEGLWVGHINAVRKVDVAAFAGDAAATKTAEGEVVANAHAIADAVAGFYGKPAGEKLFTLLAGHYGAVKAYLDATIAKNASAQSKATDQLTSNANEIAVFLSGANPYLSKDTLGEMLLAHGAQHIEQIQEFAAKNSAAEVKTQAVMKAHILALADALAEAIAKQFPTKV